MKIIGVCGGSGSGKSTVSAFLASFGGSMLDTDRIYHELINTSSPCVDALVEAFGREVLAGNTIDRNKLRDVVFSDEKKRQLLNSISHRYVLEELEKRIKNAEKENCPFVVIDAPLLFEAGLDERCDIVIAVVADRLTRVKRITERDGITEKAALERIDKQIPDDKLTGMCDAVIKNESTRDEMEKQCKNLMRVLGFCKEDKE